MAKLKNNDSIVKCLLLFIFSTYFLNAQTQIFPAKFRIQLTDKKNSPYSIKEPEKFLSLKAIERRRKQHIEIIQNDLPVNPAYTDSFNLSGITILNKSKWFNSVLILVEDSASLIKIKSFPFVAKIDTLVKSFKKSSKSKGSMTKKNITRFDFISSEKLNTENAVFNTNILPGTLYYGRSFNQINLLGGEFLHLAGYKGENMLITLLDAGFAHADVLHVFDSLRANNQILGTFDFVEPGGNVYAKASHGLYVLSLLAANIPNVMVGTAPKAKYWLLRTEDEASENVIEEDNWVAGAEFADSVGTDIISSSLGYTVFDDSLQNHTYSQMNGHVARASIGAEIAASKGILVVNSAGNSALKPFKHIGVPADADSILTVGAVDIDGIYANFSSVGPASDGRIKPNITAPGLEDAIISHKDSVIFGSGTSFSCPIISGLAACLWQSLPQLTNMQIIDLIEKSSNHYDHPDSLTGFGIPDFALAFINQHPKKIEKIIHILPNPFKNSINIIFFYNGNATIFEFEIYNINSQRIMNGMKPCVKGYNYQYLDSLDFLSQGIYLIRIKAGNEVFTAKLGKQ